MGSPYCTKNFDLGNSPFRCDQKIPQALRKGRNMDTAVIASCYDVVVVGAGIAGLSAAVAAGEKGASVLLLEKAPYMERGGNGRRSGTFRVAYGTEEELFKLVSPSEGRPIRVAPYGVEEFYSDIMRL